MSTPEPKQPDLYHKPTIDDALKPAKQAIPEPSGRMATAEELAQASKRLSKQIDENIDVFKRLADK